MKNIKLYQILICTLLAINLSSCTKDDTNTDELKAYIPAIGSSYNVIKGDIMILREEMLTGNNLKFPVLLTRPHSGDIQVKAIIDTSLVSHYDSIYATESRRFPDGLFTLANNMVTINAGQTASRDSISIWVDASKEGTTGAYVIPVVISTVNPEVPTSATRSIMYLSATFTGSESSLGTSASRTISSRVLITPEGIVGPKKLCFPGYLSRAIPKPADLTVSVADNSAVDEYNQKYKTNYRYFPADAYALSKNKVTVPADATVSRDSFEVSISDLSAFEKDCSYLLVVRLKDEGIVEASTTDQDMYLIINSSFSNINMSKTDTPDVLLSRTGWSVIQFGSEVLGTARSVLDDNINTSWLTAVAGAYLTIDMGVKQSLKGIQLTPSYKFSVSYNVPIFEIATSNDKMTWTTQGIYSGKKFAGSIASPDIRNIYFYEPPQARYFKIVFDTGSSSRYAGAAEIKGF